MPRTERLWYVPFPSTLSSCITFLPAMHAVSAKPESRPHHHRTVTAPASGHLITWMDAMRDGPRRYAPEVTYTPRAARALSARPSQCPETPTVTPWDAMKPSSSKLRKTIKSTLSTTASLAPSLQSEYETSRDASQSDAMSSRSSLKNPRHLLRRLSLVAIIRRLSTSNTPIQSDTTLDVDS